MPDVPSGMVAPPSRRAVGPDASQGSLPRPLTSFIGREHELAQAKRLHNGGMGPVILVRPDGHVAARGRPGRMNSVTGYLRYLFRETAGEPLGEHPVKGAPLAVGGSAANQQLNAVPAIPSMAGPARLIR